ncbi:hypothetical protein EYF80_022654 [Liparis tanakae]|uniref:Uncharacterized protein n=1 Tax=Liparis tanakae TaxID=230148 RepID=A0A4Z2HQ82_9TELE|nr:hypothetical protein EYF80_022654 [Liparis tanakae]
MFLTHSSGLYYFLRRLEIQRSPPAWRKNVTKPFNLPPFGMFIPHFTSSASSPESLASPLTGSIGPGRVWSRSWLLAPASCPLTPCPSLLPLAPCFLPPDSLALAPAPCPLLPVTRLLASASCPLTPCPCFLSPDSLPPASCPLTPCLCFQPPNSLSLAPGPCPLTPCPCFLPSESLPLLPITCFMLL